MDSGPYYFVKDLPLHELIAHEFINTFVKKGKKSRVVCMNAVRWGSPGRSHSNTRVLLLFWIGLLEVVCVVRCVHPSLRRPSVAQPTLCALIRRWFLIALVHRCCVGCGIWGLMERKVFRPLCSDALPLGVWLQRQTAVLPAVPVAALWRGRSPDASTAAAPTVRCRLGCSVFSLDLVALSLACAPHSHLCLLGGLARSSYFLGATCLKLFQRVFRDPPSLYTSLHKGHWHLVFGLMDVIPFFSAEAWCWGIPWQSDG